MTLKQKFEAAKKFAQVYPEDATVSEQTADAPPIESEDWAKVSELAISIEAPAEVVAEAEKSQQEGEVPEQADAGPSKRARMTGVFEAEKRAAVTMLTRELAAARINWEGEESSLANTTSWMNRDGDVLEMELLEVTNPTPPRPDEAGNELLQWARDKEKSTEEFGKKKKSDNRTLKERLEAAKKLEEEELVRLAKRKEEVERRDWEKAMEQANRLQLEEEEERRPSQDSSQWALTAECVGHGCQPISVVEIVGGWAGPFAEFTVSTLFQVLLLTAVGEKEFPHIYIIGDIIRDGRDHSRLIQKLADKKYKECIFPLNGKVIKKAMNLWGGRCAVARAQYYALTDVRAPELEGTERGESEKIRMRWNEEFVKSEEVYQDLAQFLNTATQF
jgi:hypothetical protein